MAVSTASPNVSLGGPQVILTHPHHPQMGGGHHTQQHPGAAAQSFTMVPAQQQPQPRPNVMPAQQVQVVQQRELFRL